MIGLRKSVSTHKAYKMLSKLDIKTIVILVLLGVVIVSFIFRPSKPIEMYEDEIILLNKKNKQLSQSNDSLELVNNQLDKEIEGYLNEIDSTQLLLDENKEKITELEDGKNKVSGYVNSLNADGVTESLTDYLNRRK
jgi:peptidoglycan hydrolase CwlO-like protein